MANDKLKPLEFANPFLPWVEQGLRIFDQTVTSSQNMGEAVDRAVRADGNADRVAATAQHNMFELMTQAWVQWMSWLGSMAGLGTKAVLPRDAVRQVLASPRPAAQAPSARGERQHKREHAEHALASGEPKRRRGNARKAAKTTARRSRQSRA